MEARASAACCSSGVQLQNHILLLCAPSESAILQPGKLTAAPRAAEGSAKMTQLLTLKAGGHLNRSWVSMAVRSSADKQTGGLDNADRGCAC